MQRMVARITGIIKGNNTSGNSNSRALARRVIAAVIVPKTQKPTVPNKVTKKSCGSKFQAGKLNKIQNSGMTTSLDQQHQNEIETGFGQEQRAAIERGEQQCIQAMIVALGLE